MTYANLPALLEGNNLEESFEKIYGRSCKSYLEEYEATDETIRCVLHDLQVYADDLVITNSEISASNIYVNREALHMLTDSPSP